MKATRQVPQQTTARKDPPRIAFLGVLAYLLLAGAVFFVVRGQVQVGLALLGIAVMSQIVAWFTKRPSASSALPVAENPSSKDGVNPKAARSRADRAEIPPPPIVPKESNRAGWAFALLVVSWFVFGLNQLAFKSFTFMAPWVKELPFKSGYMAMFLGFLGMVVAFRLLPQARPIEDMSRRTARIFFWLAMGLATFFLYYQGIQPIGAYWDDQALEIMDPRFCYDMSDYRHAFIFPTGCREPFYSYLNIALWNLFPGASTLFVQRLSGAVVFLALIWVLYLLGKELRDRRLGVLMALMGALSKPIIMKSLQGMRISSLMLGSALALLFFIRLSRKPDLSHFVQWAFAVSFGLYTYATYRPFVPFFVLGTLAWFVFQGRERKASFPEKLLVGVTTLAFVFYIFYSNNVVSKENIISWAMDFNGTLVPVGLLIAFAFSLLFLLRRGPQEALNDVWFGWVAGTSLVTLLTYPVMTDPTILGRMKDLQLATGSFMDSNYIQEAIHKLRLTFDILFIAGYDRSDLSILVDAFFGYAEVVLIALGLAYLVARPSRRGVFIFLTALVGVSSYVLTQGPHTGRLVGCTGPFLALGLIGLMALVDVSFERVRWVQLPRLWMVLAVLFGFWVFRTDLTCVYDRWFNFYVDKHVLTYQNSKKDLKSGRKVFVGKSLDGRTAAALQEGTPVLAWRDQPTLFLDVEEKVPEVVVYIEPSQNETINAMREKFPSVTPRELRDPNHLPNGPVIVLAYDIPADVVERSGVFQIRRLERPYWSRRVTLGEYGFGMGYLLCEDKVVDAATMPCVNSNLVGLVVEYTGKIRVPKKDSFHLKVVTDNRTRVTIDGKEVFDIRYLRTNNFMAPQKVHEEDLRLAAGEHDVRVITYYQRAGDMPVITWCPKGKGNAVERSLWKDLEWAE